MDSTAWSVPRGNKQQWIETRGGRSVTVTEHPVRGETVEFLNEPDDPETGTLTLKFHLEPGHTVAEHCHPDQVETFTINTGELRVTIDGKEHTAGAGDHEKIPKGVPHKYTVISDDPVTLSVTMTPALNFKDFVVAEHALTRESYPKNGLNIPYFSVVTNAYGPAIAAPKENAVTRVMGAILPMIARIKGLKIPDEPLPVRGDDSLEQTANPTGSDAR